MNVFGEAVAGLVEQSKAAIPTNESDYMDNGLLYCGKCKTPKQCVIQIFGQEYKPMCLCKCEEERYQREEEERKNRERLNRLSKLRSDGFQDSEMGKWSFATDDGTDAKSSGIAQKYVDQFKRWKNEGKGLLLYGGVGTGKTFTAACIVNALIDKGVPCLMTNVARTVSAMQSSENRQQYLDNLNGFDLMVLDDLGAERETEFMQEQVMQLIDARYRSGLPMIVTTNLTAAQIKNPDSVQKERIYSRLMEMCFPVEMNGQDRRKAKLKAGWKDAAEALGL